MKTLIHVAFCTCLVSVVNAGGNAPVDAVVERATRAFIATHPRALAMSIGVYRDGRTSTYDYGHLEPDGHRAPTRDTLYPIASITKTFTGMLLAQAQLEGKVKLDDDVRKYLDGDFPNLEFQGHPVRLFDLLDHRSGLPFFLPDRPDTRPDFPGGEPWAARIAAAVAGYSRADFYADLRKVNLDSIPGESFKYSNAAAQLAGYVLERVYGESYESLLKRKIFGPLHMSESTITLSARQFAARTRGYDGDWRQMPDMPNEAQAAAAIKSSVRDMLKYIAWQMDERVPEVELAHRPVFTSYNYAAGLNWQMLTVAGKRIIWQSGNIEGIHAYCIVEPELKLGLVALFNQSDKATDEAHGAMVNEILKGLDSQAALMP